MPDQDPLRELLERTQPSLKRLFTRFRMPSDVVEEVLEDCLMVLVYRHDELAHPDRWLLRTVRFRCVRYWRKRRFDLCLRAQHEILRWLEDESCSEGERQRRRRELFGYLEEIPVRCRKLLAELFHLIPPSGSPENSDPLRSRDSSKGPYTAESPTVRCLSRLLQRLLKDPPQDLANLPLL